MIRIWVGPNWPQNHNSSLTIVPFPTFWDMDANVVAYSGHVQDEGRISPSVRVHRCMLIYKIATANIREASWARLTIAEYDVVALDVVYWTREVPL